MKKKKMLHKHTLPTRYRNGEWEYETTEFEVTVMAIVGKWAMVRRVGCVPFVVGIDTLVEEGEPESLSCKIM